MEEEDATCLIYRRFVVGVGSSSSSSSARLPFLGRRIKTERSGGVFQSAKAGEDGRCRRRARMREGQTRRSGTRDVNREKDDDEAFDLFSHGAKTREKKTMKKKKTLFKDTTRLFRRAAKDQKEENALSSIGRRTVMSSAAFGAMTSSSSSITLLSFPDKAKATPRDIEWGAPGVTKRAFKFDVPLRVNVLRGTIPANVFEEFKETQASPRLKLQHSASASLAKSFQDLRRGRQYWMMEGT